MAQSFDLVQHPGVLDARTWHEPRAHQALRVKHAYIRRHIDTYVRGTSRTYAYVMYVCHVQCQHSIGLQWSETRQRARVSSCESVNCSLAARRALMLCGDGVLCWLQPPCAGPQAPAAAPRSA